MRKRLASLASTVGGPWSMGHRENIIWLARGRARSPGNAGVRPGTPDGMPLAGRPFRPRTFSTLCLASSPPQLATLSSSPPAGGGENAGGRRIRRPPTVDHRRAAVVASGLLFGTIAILFSSTALADSGAPALDLTTGVPAQILGKTMGMAQSLFPFLLILGLALEFFGGSPTAGRDYGGCLFRALVVMMLLAFYGRIFGSLVNMATSFATRIAPQTVWEDFTKAQDAWQRQVFAQKTQADQEAEAAVGGQSLTSKLANMAGLAGGIVGGYFFDSIVALGLLVAEAAHWVLVNLARVLTALLYVLGPLPLVFSIPRASDTGGRWFRIFVTVLTWPILASILLALTLAIGLKSQTAPGASSAFGSVASAMLMAAIAVATPLLAKEFVGGAAHFAHHGWQTAKGHVVSVGDSAKWVFRSDRKQFEKSGKPKASSAGQVAGRGASPGPGPQGAA
jgi:hypothetical protein